VCGESQLDILLECGLVFLKGLERLKVGGIRAGFGYGLLRHLSLEIRRCKSANSIHFIKIVSIVGQPISSTEFRRVVVRQTVEIQQSLFMRIWGQLGDLNC